MIGDFVFWETITDLYIMTGSKPPEVFDPPSYCSHPAESTIESHANDDLKSPDLMRISQTGLVFMLCVCKFILLQMLFAMFMVFLGRISNIFKSLKGGCALRNANTGNVNWSNSKYGLFLYVRNYSGIIKHERISIRNVFKYTTNNSLCYYIAQCCTEVKSLTYHASSWNKSFLLLPNCKLVSCFSE